MVFLASSLVKLAHHRGCFYFSERQLFNRIASQLADSFDGWQNEIVKHQGLARVVKVNAIIGSEKTNFWKNSKMSSGEERMRIYNINTSALNFFTTQLQQPRVENIYIVPIFGSIET